MANTTALVKETLTKDEVMSLFNETLTRNGNINNYLTILKGEYTTWDDDVHMGYIVCHHTKKRVVPELTYSLIKHAESTGDSEMLQPRIEESDNYYFMEVTLEEVNNPFKTSHLWKPTFHKLMPITENYKPRRRFHEGNTKELCDYIIDCVHRDNWNYIEVPMTKDEIDEGKKRDWWWYSHHTTKTCPLTYNDIYSYWSTPLTEEEQKIKDKENKEEETKLISMFSSGELPSAEADAWYSILSSGYGSKGYDLECKIIKILKNRGYSVRIDGERDSFGWVTRGIWVDNKMMCIY